MNSRKLTLAAIATLVGAMSAPMAAHAAWTGVKSFNCVRSGANWHFDGLYGKDTERAVKAFQKAHHIPQTGTVGPETSKALGLKFRRELRCGLGGDDVAAVQRALSAKGFWYGEAKPVTPSHVPSQVPSHKPSHKPTTTPSAAPSEMPTPMPTEMPATPAPQPTEVAPTPSPEESAAPTEEMWRPTFTLSVGDWMLAAPANNNLTADAKLWFGDFGIGADVVDFGLGGIPVAARPGTLTAPTSLMWDGNLDWRFGYSGWALSLGYRGFNTAFPAALSSLPANGFGTLCLDFNHDWAYNWLNFDAHVLGGTAFNANILYDAQATVGLNLGWFGIDGGYRYFGSNNAMLPNQAGPVADLRVRF